MHAQIFQRRLHLISGPRQIPNLQPRSNLHIHAPSPDTSLADRTDSSAAPRVPDVAKSLAGTAVPRTPPPPSSYSSSLHLPRRHKKRHSTFSSHPSPAKTPPLAGSHAPPLRQLQPHLSPADPFTLLIANRRRHRQRLLGQRHNPRRRRHDTAIAGATTSGSYTVPGPVTDAASAPAPSPAPHAVIASAVTHNRQAGVSGAFRSAGSLTS